MKRKQTPAWGLVFGSGLSPTLGGPVSPYLQPTICANRTGTNEGKRAALSVMHFLTQSQIATEEMR